jgi:hypothetical protein
MRTRDMLLTIAVFYLLLFSSLAVHEFGHIYSAQYITKDCMFTESKLTLDFLILRRSGMTYFTCSSGVNRLKSPLWSIDLADPLEPKISVQVAKAEGIQLVTSPLTTGWFTALMGPILEIAYVTVAIDWLSRTFKRLEAIRAAYLPFLVIVFFASRMDFAQAATQSDSVLFSSAYVLAFALIALSHLTLNLDYYRGLSR